MGHHIRELWAYAIGYGFGGYTTWLISKHYYCPAQKRANNYPKRK